MTNRDTNRAVDYVPCLECGGHGRVALPPPHQRTLNLVRDGATSAADLARAEGVAHQVMCNRLEKLRSLGLVRREAVSGREWAYHAE